MNGRWTHSGSGKHGGGLFLRSYICWELLCLLVGRLPAACRVKLGSWQGPPSCWHWPWGASRPVPCCLDLLKHVLSVLGERLPFIPTLIMFSKSGELGFNVGMVPFWNFDIWCWDIEIFYLSLLIVCLLGGKGYEVSRFLLQEGLFPFLMTSPEGQPLALENKP